MLETISFSDPAVWWRIAASAAAALVALGVIVWIGRLRTRASRQVVANTSGQAGKTRKPLGTAHLLLSLASIAAAGWVGLQIWGVDTSTLFASRGGFALRGVVRVIIIIAIAAAALEVTDLAARTLLERAAGKGPAAPPPSARRPLRGRHLAPVPERAMPER